MTNETTTIGATEFEVGNTYLELCRFADVRAGRALKMYRQLCRLAGIEESRTTIDDEGFMQRERALHGLKDGENL